MNCLHCSKHMYKYYDGEISPQLRLEVDNHLAVCPFCRFQYDLTLMENEVLRDVSDIPELSPDFNERVMNAITPEILPHLPNNVLVISKDKHINFRWSSVYTKSAIAVVFLLALCFYIPGIFIGGQQPKIAQNDQASTVQKTSAHNSVSFTGTSSPIQDQAKQIIKAPDNGTLQSPQSSVNSKTLPLPPQTKMEAAAAPQVYAGTRMSPFETGRSERKSITAETPSVSSLSLKNIPVKYKLVSQDNSIQNQIAYSYQTDDGTEIINIQLITLTSQDQSISESANTNISEPLMMLKAPATEENISREIQVEDLKISINVAGNISKDELNHLADQIIISKNP